MSDNDVSIGEVNEDTVVKEEIAQNEEAAMDNVDNDTVEETEVVSNNEIADSEDVNSDVSTNIENPSYIEFKNVSKIYRMGEVEIKALDNISLEIEQGKFTVVLGASGAGKTTILNLLGGMDRASSGDMIIDGENISKLNDNDLCDYRRYDIGFVFQFYNLVQNLTAIENVELAAHVCKNPLDPVEVLKMVGLEERMGNFPSQLSGGEQQRVAIARAVCKNPKLLLCDEPTGALDYVTGKQVLKVLQDMCFEKNMTVVMITHNAPLAAMAQKVIHVKSGKVEKVEYNENPKKVEDIEY